jgi:hypothetical protein
VAGRSYSWCVQAIRAEAGAYRTVSRALQKFAPDHCFSASVPEHPPSLTQVNPKKIGNSHDCVMDIGMAPTTDRFFLVA